MQLPRRGLAPEFPRITVAAKFRELCAINNAGARWFNPKVPRARVDHNFAGDGICVAIHQQEAITYRNAFTYAGFYLGLRPKDASSGENNCESAEYVSRPVSTPGGEISVLSTFPSPSLSTFPISLPFLFANTTVTEITRPETEEIELPMPPRRPLVVFAFTWYISYKQPVADQTCFSVERHHPRSYSDILLVCGRDGISLDHPRFTCHDRDDDLTASVQFS